MNSARATFTTSGPITGARSLRCNNAGVGAASANTVANVIPAGGRLVLRFKLKFQTSLPNADTALAVGNAAGTDGVYFKQSDSKIYAGFDLTSLGATGVSVVADTTYTIDLKIDSSANPHLIDVSVNGVACGQASHATTAATSAQVVTLGVGIVTASCTADVLFDDVVTSGTLGDYPIGAGFVHAFIPTSDGTHNVAGANDFERTLTGTDITNATTTAFQLIDDQPVKATTGAPADFINLIAPPNATDYVECIYGAASGSSTPTTAPRAVEVLVGYAAVSAGAANNIRLALNDNGTTNDVFNGASGGVNPTYTSKQYATAPSTGAAWTAALFNNLRIRCFTNDATPDPYFTGTMIEAEFATVAGRTTKNTRAFPLGDEVGMGFGIGDGA